MRKTLCVCYALMLVNLCLPTSTWAQPQQTKKPNVEKFIQQPEAFKAAAFDGAYYVNLSFEKIPNKQTIAELKNQGIELIAYQSGTTYLATVPKNNNKDLLNGIGLSNITMPDNRQKLSAAISENNIPEYANLSNNKIAVALIFHESIPTEKINQILTESRAFILEDRHRDGKTIVAELDIDMAKQLSTHPAIAYVDIKQEPAKLLNHEVRTQQTVNALNNRTGVYNLRGNGITVGVGDGGKLGDHIDFDNRANNIATNAYSSYGNHGDHVAGIIGGGGHINPRHTGVAPECDLLIQKTSSITYNTEDYWNDYEMVLTNNSYGTTFSCTENGKYNYTSQSLDKQMNEYPKVLHVFAAGNSGASTCAPFPKGYKTVLKFYQSAKNVLTVGNVKENMEINVNSSRGPVNDGRLKPEICGIGSGVYSTGRNYDYPRKSGTSMASPAVAGTLALMNEAYRNANGGDIPDGGLMKAIACNTARDLGNPGPDYIYGFGLIDGKKAVDAINANQYYDNVLGQGDEQETTITVPAGEPQLNILLYWHDKEAAPYPDKALINDLDLEIVDPNGNVVLPWILNPDVAGVDQNAIRGVDTLNNIEQVTIANPVQGNYTIRVKGSNIPLGTQKYYVTYKSITNEVALTYPYGGEKLEPGTLQYITWDAPSSNTVSFNLKYSLDNGDTWMNIASNIDANQRTYKWTVPNNFTTEGLIQVECSGTTNRISENATPFQITPIPANFNIEPLCEGVLGMSWDEIPGYEMELCYFDGTTMQVVDTLSGNSVELDHELFDIGNTYWLSLRAMAADGSTGTRCPAKSISPQATGNCPWAYDVALRRIETNLIGREATSIALSNREDIRFMIYNQGTSPTTTIDVSYQINNGTVVTETINTPISIGDSILYTFATKADLSQASNYAIDGWIAGQDDTRNENDEILGLVTARQLPNNNITFSPSTPLTEAFQTAQTGLYEDETTGLAGIEAWDYYNSTSESKLEVNDETGALHLLPKGNNLSSDYDNQLIWTLNLSQVNLSSGDLLLDFKYLNQTIAPLSNPTNRSNEVLVRGNDQEDWIVLTTLADSEEEWVDVQDLNINTALNSAGQTVSSSFQIKFRQLDEVGFAIDDIQLMQVLPLPVTLTHFKAEVIKTDVLLSWDTSSESNNDYFNIELAIGDEAAQAGDFQSIGTVRGNGTTNIPNHYEFWDRQPNKDGNRYYRLKQVDYDGAYTYSPIRMVTISAPFIAEVYPNPFQSVLKIHYQTNTARDLTLQLLNAQGQVVTTRKIRTTEGRQVLKLELGHQLMAGSYILRIPEDEQFKPQRVVKYQD